MTYLRLFLSFMKIGFCSFGGMTMIPVINDEVLRYGWMTPEEVMDIVAVAEMTPGSLGINCATFVGLRTAGMTGALCASLGVMMPSLTLSMAAAHFIFRLKDNPYLESAMRGVRPASMGMLMAAAVTLGLTTYVNTAERTIAWNLVGIAIVSVILLIKGKLSIPKTILIAAILGLFVG
ncbi:chromate transporter [Clostridiaceae bacterium]|nr:chromate transporter [Clostridiaceae bacterium]RKI10399.1 chromate transporter [bacterium 1XD21-70]